MITAVNNVLEGDGILIKSTQMVVKAVLCGFILLNIGFTSGCSVTDTTESDASWPTIAIYTGNDLYDEVPFGEEQVITIDKGNGITNEITLTQDAVYMSDSSCENHDCVLQGEITFENYEKRALLGWIICLPNQVTIEYIPGEEG